MATLTATPKGRLAVSPRIEERLQRGELTQAQVDQFQKFLAEVDRELLQHRIILDNPSRAGSPRATSAIKS